MIFESLISIWWALYVRSNYDIYDSFRSFFKWSFKVFSVFFKRYWIIISDSNNTDVLNWKRLRKTQIRQLTNQSSAFTVQKFMTRKYWLQSLIFSKFIYRLIFQKTAGHSYQSKNESLSASACNQNRHRYFIIRDTSFLKNRSSWWVEIILK